MSRGGLGVGRQTDHRGKALAATGARRSALFATRRLGRWRVQAAGTIQSSQCRPGVPSKWRTLWVTSVSLSATAWEAIWVRSQRVAHALLQRGRDTPEVVADDVGVEQVAEFAHLTASLPQPASGSMAGGGGIVARRDELGAVERGLVQQAEEGLQLVCARLGLKGELARGVVARDPDFGGVQAEGPGQAHGLAHCRGFKIRACACLQYSFN